MVSTPTATPTVWWGGFLGQGECRHRAELSRGWVDQDKIMPGRGRGTVAEVAVSFGAWASSVLQPSLTTYSKNQFFTTSCE